MSLLDPDMGSFFSFAAMFELEAPGFHDVAEIVWLCLSQFAVSVRLTTLLLTSRYLRL